MNSKMRVTFKGRVGVLNVYTNEVSFDGYIFKSILEAIDFIDSDYELNSRKAKEIAEEYYKAEKVLGKIAETIGL